MFRVDIWCQTVSLSFPTSKHQPQHSSNWGVTIINSPQGNLDSVPTGGCRGEGGDYETLQESSSGSSKSLQQCYSRVSPAAETCCSDFCFLKIKYRRKVDFCLNRHNKEHIFISRNNKVIYTVLYIQYIYLLFLNWMIQNNSLARFPSKSPQS